MGAERLPEAVRPEPGRVAKWYTKGHCRGCMRMLLKYSTKQIEREELSITWTEDILAAFDSLYAEKEKEPIPLRGDWREHDLDLAAIREAKIQYMADAASDFMRDAISAAMEMRRATA